MTANVCLNVKFITAIDKDWFHLLEAFKINVHNTSDLPIASTMVSCLISFEGLKLGRLQVMKF